MMNYKDSLIASQEAKAMLLQIEADCTKNYLTKELLLVKSTLLALEIRRMKDLRTIKIAR